MATAKPIKGTDMKEINPKALPAGTSPTNRKVFESTMGGLDERLHASYTSLDGEEYIFRTHDNKGKPLPWRENLAMFLAFREVGLGGSPFTVLDAFRVSIKDATGKEVYPLKVSTDTNLNPEFTLG